MKPKRIEDYPTPGAHPGNCDELYTDERWRVLGDLIPDGLIMVDATGLVRYMNSAAENINDVYRQMVVGHPLEDFVQQSHLDYSVLLDVFYHGNASVNQVVSDANGVSYLISTRSYRTWSGESSVFMIVLRNLNVLAKATRRDNEAPMFAPPPAEAKPLDTEPIISDKATATVVSRGLAAIAMNVRLLILGESGVGKSELVRLLHRKSGAPTRPLVHVNCGSIPDSLFESEMFGYERGAFTGASSHGKKGLIEVAEGGILFLDEVGEIPLHCQAKILQVLEEGLVQRVGATVPRRLQLQIIAATNHDLRALVAAGRFRRDLYYRLSVVTLILPPLRERRELIPLLLERFLGGVNQRRNHSQRKISPLEMDSGCRRRLLEHSYPGNVRELQNIVEYLGVVCGQTATEADLPLEQMALSIDKPFSSSPMNVAPTALSPEISESPDFPADFNLRETIRRYESSLIDAAIRKTGSKRKAAELLGIDIATVVRKSKTRVQSPSVAPSLGGIGAK